MFGSTNFSVPALAVILTATALVIPATSAAQGVSGEQAMLNRSIERYVGAIRASVEQLSGSPTIDGAQALPGRSFPAGGPTVQVEGSCSLDGAWALLGTCARTEAQKRE